MLDDNWELINGPDAHDIEVLNYSSQINVLEALVRYLMHHDGGGPGVSCKLWPSEMALREIHRTGTIFLLKEPGQYRETHVHLQRQDGVVVYDPPPWEEMPKHVQQFFSDLSDMWPNSTPVQIAAFCLWRINWIHPFKNGNGRCARAFMYACLCLKFGMMLPGAPTVIDLITADKKPFEDALQAADKALLEGGGVRDCRAIEAYIEGLLVTQLSSVPAA